MLLDLTVSQLALVDELNLNFTHGMTVITGETGAGKSILLTALNLILGGKADPILIRNGAEKAEIHATFDLKGLSGALLWLAEVDLTLASASNECLIRRVLYLNGRSKAYINGQPVTQTQLRVLGEYLIQMHGQHKHQLLLKPYEQLRLLDEFGHHESFLNQCRSISHNYDKLMKQKNHLINSQHGLGEQLALLAYQVEELEQLDLKEDEFLNISQIHTELAHSEENALKIQHALESLEKQSSELMNISPSLKKLPSLENKLKNCLELMNLAEIHFNEAIQELSHINDNIELDPQKLSGIEMRLNQYQSMARKHRVKPENLFIHMCDLQSKMLDLKHASTHIETIDEQLNILKKDFESIASQLSQARKKSAISLSAAITQAISELGMEKAVFTIAFSKINAPNEPTPYGHDQIEYCVSANPGHPAQPLNRVASGGELSRISLAIQLITAAAEHTPTLIFDEADVGIGGETALKVGQTLRALGKKAQVLCVTHLPQVAGYGQHHLLVKKQSNQQNTVTQITVLDKVSRLKELARMLSGDSDSHHALNHAESLLITCD